MNKKEILSGSFRILKRNKMRTFFMILGIIIGIASLSITFTIGKGIQKQIADRVKKYLSTNSIAIFSVELKMEGNPQTDGKITTLTIDDIKTIASEVPGVSAYDVCQMLQGREIIAGNKNISTTIKGYSVAGETVWNRTVTRGEYFNAEEELNASRVALIGPSIADALFGQSDPIGAQIRIGDIPFIVKGVLEPKGIDPHGNDMDLDVVIPVTTMMKRVMNVDYLAMAKLQVDDENRTEEIAASVATILRERHHIEGNNENDFKVITPTFVQAKIKEMTRVFTVLLPIISLIALLAAGIVIVVLMLMSVNERINEIGLRKAVGARSKDILAQFIVEVSATSILGGIIGVIIGLACFKVFAVSMHLSFYVPWQIYVLGTLLPILVGTGAGILPARKAAKLNPVEALR